MKLPWMMQGYHRLACCNQALQSAFRRTHTQSASTLLQQLTNYEATGVPKNAGVDGNEGFDLARMHHLLQLLGQPQKQLQVIHVAGTKGKGSVAVFLERIMHAAGFCTGLYTSPHVTSLSERIQTSGVPIPFAQFDDLVQRNWPVLQQAQEWSNGQLSYFEALTALALRHFADSEVDIGIIETGLGGARDATNVFDPENLRCAVITAIGMEHKDALGGTLQSIAKAKAGVCKRGRPLILAPQPEADAEEVIVEAAQKLQCHVYRVGDLATWHLRETKQEGSSITQQGKIHLEPQLAAIFGLTPANSSATQPSTSQNQTFTATTGATAATQAVSQQSTSSFQASAVSGNPQTPEIAVLPVNLQFLGPHQGANACTAVVAAAVLRSQGGEWEAITAGGVQQGLAEATLPGRFQVLKLPPQGGQGAPPFLVLDGAHTPASAAALVDTLQQVFLGAPLGVVVAMAADKDHAGFMQELRQAQPSVALFSSADIAGASTRCAAPGTLLAQWQTVGMRLRGPKKRCREMMMASVTASVQRALMEVTSIAEPGVSPVVLVTGSLHAVAEALKAKDALLQLSSVDH